MTQQKTQHTPGPWTFQREDGGKMCVGPEQGPTVAQVNARLDATLANASLIAAAPEMLEALRDIARTPEGDEDSAQAIARALLARLDGGK